MLVDAPFENTTERVADLIKVIRANPNAHPNTVFTRFRGVRGTVGRRDVATHWIHWYPAKMFHRIPAEILTASGANRLTVLDPFCGSGTVLLEATLRGHFAIGIDVNPLARLISKVKTTRLDVRSLTERANSVARGARAESSKEGIERLPSYWFRPGPRLALVRMHRQIQTVTYRPHRDFLSVCLSAIVRQSSLADPSIPPPVRLSRHRESRATNRYTRHLKRAFSTTIGTVHDAFYDRVRANIARMSDLARATDFGRAKIMDDNAEAAATGLPPRSVDLIITSPPYCGAQKYVRSLSLEMLLLGFLRSELQATDRRTLGTERLSTRNATARLHTPLKEADALIRTISRTNTTRALMVAEYVRYLKRFVVECARVLKRGGEAFVTFGTGHVAGIAVEWDHFFRILAADAGLSLVAVFVDRIPSRGLMTARRGTAATIDDERVVWLRKK